MSQVALTATLEEFFMSKLGTALAQQKTAVSDEVSFYLVSLLSHYARSQNLFTTKPDGHVEYRALALRLHDAVFDRPERKFLHLKNLGDTALYHAGVFYDGLYNQPVGIDYYIDMGCGAYHSLANLRTSTGNPLADTFAELAKRFGELVEVLHVICEAEVAGHAHDLLRLLDRYQKTGSLSAKAILTENGIDPDLTISGSSNAS